MDFIKEALKNGVGEGIQDFVEDGQLTEDQGEKAQRLLDFILSDFLEGQDLSMKAAIIVTDAYSALTAVLRAPAGAEEE